jgi:hypothetical protein
MAHACNPSTKEDKFEANSGYRVRPYLRKTSINKKSNLPVSFYFFNVAIRKFAIIHVAHMIFLFFPVLAREMSFYSCLIKFS